MTSHGAKQPADMTLEELFLAAQAGGLTATEEGDKLRVRGSKPVAETIGRELIRRKAEVLPLLREQAATAPVEAAKPTPAGEEPPATHPHPSPPAPNAKLWLCDASGRECKPGDEVYMWCWTGGAQWYYASEIAPPVAPQAAEHGTSTPKD